MKIFINCRWRCDKMEGLFSHCHDLCIASKYQNIKIHNIYYHAYRQFIICSNTILTHFAGCEWAECQNALFLPCGYCFPSRFQFIKTKKHISRQKNKL